MASETLSGKIEKADFKLYVSADYTNPALVDAATLKERIGYYGDGLGLYLAVGAGTARSWVFKFSFGGKRMEMGLGSVSAVDLQAARKAAKTCRELVAEGINPKAHRERRLRDQIIEVNRATASFHQLAARAQKNPMVCGVSVKDVKRRREWLASMAPKLTANVTASPPCDITRADVATAINAIRERGSMHMANKVLKRMKAVFEWCAGNGFMSEDAANPADFSSVRAQMVLPVIRPKKATHASVPYAEAPALVARLRRPQPLLQRNEVLCLEWIMLSAVRAAPGISADWSEINPARTVWTIPADKMKEDGHGAHAVPITSRMRAILDELAEAGTEGGLFFSEPETEGYRHGQAMRATLRAVYPYMITREDGSKRKAAVHGLRTTFRTWGENVMEGGQHKYEEKMLELCLAHVVGDAARNAYVKETNVELRREIMEAWCAYLGPVSTPAAAAPTETNVTQFPERKAA